MESEISDVIKAMFYSAGAVGIAYFWHRTRVKVAESENETYVSRTQATRELLSDPNYNDYLRRRAEIADKLMQDDPNYLDKFQEPNLALKCRIDAIIGDYTSK